MAQNVLAVDLGGTKVLAAVINPDGKILKKLRENIDPSRGPTGVTELIVKLSKSLLQDFPNIKTAALASAGPLDPVRGLWLSPTNITTDGEHWGVYPIIERLEKGTGIKWSLENDAAAAVRAEVWLGQAKNEPDAIAVTLGTGLGVGVWANGILVRAGRLLHPEAGHIIIEHKDKEVRCGCGNWGCAEAYLSGVNFTKWLGKKWQRDLTGEDLVVLAREGDPRAVAEFQSYGERMAVFFTALIVLFCPRKIVIAGGFSHSSDLFLSTTNRKLVELLSSRRDGEDLLPAVFVSSFQDEAGVIGAAQLALSLDK